MDEASPARLYASAIGALLVIAGILGFFYNGHFGSGDDVFGNDASVKVLGLFAVNGWHNVFHLVTGAAALLAAGYVPRACALGLGTIYAAAAVWGFVIGSGDAILSIVPVNTADNLLHAAIGALGIAAGLAHETRGTKPAPAG
jgi:Domain of unknown function (DUF4383)